MKKIWGRIEKKESEKEIGYDCSCCDFACKLPNKDLQNDFFFCGNPDGNELNNQINLKGEKKW